MNKKIIIAILALVLIFTLGSLVLAEVLPGRANQRTQERINQIESEIGPGLNCGDCEDGPLLKQRQLRENRGLQLGNNGAMNKARVQRMRSK